jgi:neutral amino acid transport system permease protein
MESGQMTAAAAGGSGSSLRSLLRDNPAWVALGIMLVIAVALIIGEGLQAFGQRSVNGLVAGSYFALGAIGLTLVYGILKLVNFAHGDMLTFGAYVAFLFDVTFDLPLVLALLAGVIATAALGVAQELTMWRPMRRKRAGTLQLLLMSLGLAFLLRYAIQFVAGTEPRTLDTNVTSSIDFLGLSIGETELIVLVVAFVVLVSVATMLRVTSLGRQMRALADNFDLAETTGIDTGRVVLRTWVLAGALAGLAGVLVVASTGSLTPNTGFFLLLPLFAAVVLGGIGNAYGALAGGLVIGLTQEWSTLIIDSQWKVAVSFLVLIFVLMVRPEGIFGRERTL